MERLESTVLASPLDRVDVLVATIVTRSGITLGILIRHGRTKSVENSARSHVLRSDENYGFALTLNLVFLPKPNWEE